jgi:putative membrane protein
VGHIIGPVLTVTAFSAGVVYAHDKGKSVTLANSVTPLLAVVVSYPIVEDVVYDTYSA